MHFICISETFKNALKSTDHEIFVFCLKMFYLLTVTAIIRNNLQLWCYVMSRTPSSVPDTLEGSSTSISPADTPARSSNKRHQPNNASPVLYRSAWGKLATHLLVAWHSGRTSVFGLGNFAVLRLTCSWWVTTYVGKPSAVGQPTMPTQPFILSGVDKWVVGCN